MRHLASSLRVGSKAAATAVAATLVVGGVAVAQTGSAAPDDEVVAGDGSDEDGSDADASDGGEGTSTDPDDGSDPDDEHDPEDEDDPDGSVDDGAAGDDDGEGDDGDGGDDLDVEPTDDGDEATPVDDEDDRGRGSATSERVHEAQTLDGQLRPGDEGWGAAVSESARSGGHGERVSRAARGLDASPPAEPGADAAASTTRKDPPGRSARAGGQAPGQGSSKDRGSR